MTWLQRPAGIQPNLGHLEHGYAATKCVAAPPPTGAIARHVNA
jgi:hypothetical protein